VEGQPSAFTLERQTSKQSHAFLKGLPAGSRIGVESTVSYRELVADVPTASAFF